MDIISRIKDKRLNYIKAGKASQAFQLFSIKDINKDSKDLDNTEARFAGTLPSSFIGSKAWSSERVTDRLALTRTHGKLY